MVQEFPAALQTFTFQSRIPTALGLARILLIVVILFIKEALFVVVQTPLRVCGYLE